MPFRLEAYDKDDCRFEACTVHARIALSDAIEWRTTMRRERVTIDFEGAHFSEEEFTHALARRLIPEQDLPQSGV